MKSATLKSGFSLIELLIATVIGAIISVLLFVAFDQINKYVVTVEDFTDISLRDATLHQQLEKDLSGAFVPVAAMKAGKDGEKPTSQREKNKQEQTTKKTGEEKPKKDKQKPLEKVFYGTNKENNIDVLSFITGNSLQSYWGSKTGKPKPRVVRVVYRLLPEKDSKKSFRLTRQEGIDLNFDVYKAGGSKTIREFTMIENIKSLQTEYWEQKKDKEDKEGKQTAQSKKKREFTKRKEWNTPKKRESQESKDAKDKKENKEPLIPDIIVFKGELWDIAKKYASPFEFKFELNSAASSPEYKEKSPMPGQQEKKEKDAKEKGPIDARDLIARFPSHLADMFKGTPMQATTNNQPMVMTQQDTMAVMNNMHMMQQPTIYNGQNYVLTGNN